MTRKSVKFVREGKFAADVAVDPIEEPGGWSPYLSVADAENLDAMRRALRDGDLAAASRIGRIFELTPLSG